MRRPDSTHLKAEPVTGRVGLQNRFHQARPMQPEILIIVPRPQERGVAKEVL
jgi:hypothetical protein